MRKPSAIPPQVVQDYWRLFVNRRAYTLQSARPHPETGRHYYFRPSDKRTGASLELTEDIIRRLATSAGPQADIAIRTAESVGERVGDAYATTDEVKAGPRKVARRTASQTSWAAQQPFTAVAAGFALGYAAALLVHRRQ